MPDKPFDIRREEFALNVFTKNKRRKIEEIIK